MNRRTYLTTAAGISAVAFAGCAELDNPDESDDDDEPSDGDASDNGDEGDDETGGVEEFDDFEDLDDWETIEGSLSADEDRYYTGSQSAHLEAEADGRVTIARELSDSEDFSGMSPGLAVESGSLSDLLIQLFDDDGDLIAFRSEIGELSFERTNFGVAEADDDADMDEVSEIQITMLGGEDDGREIWIDNLHFVPRPDDGMVMIQLDGGYENHYTEALGILEEYDYPATAFVPPGRIRENEQAEGDRLTEEQLEELADADWTIASNTHNAQNPTGLDDDEQEDAFADAVEWLEDNGYEDGAKCVSYPTGRYNERTLELCAEHHELGFAGRYGVGGYATNPTLCPRVSDPSAGEVEQLLEWTAELGGITSLAYFELDESLEEFENAVEAISEYEEGGEITVIQPETVENEYVIND
ncbi:polysaccharide deacetylase family protein [Halostagnicola bangensis]